MRILGLHCLQFLHNWYEDYYFMFTITVHWYKNNGLQEVVTSSTENITENIKDKFLIKIN